jgi:protein xylosyltransferase
MKGMTFLKNELKSLQKSLDIKNMFVSDRSFRTIWGGSSLLKMHLKVFNDLVLLRERHLWQWDFVLNLSESDFPLKTVEELTMFLNDYKDFNFLKFHSSPTDR